ncbi:IS607 family transposase [Bifidobacterium amazonense]|uniref:IS607 family transposase n=1 Tax=Bifidobacterium amazonense TaxID=2809027 RepID=A0ABS9VUY2_9BIFI|nr:IS607 family transposase [Bifidobacterium amazonense]MCH9275764.1 IS607 family transposase [Bifidobacterium amazonense]
MKLSEYARIHGIQYRAAWERFRLGRIPGAYKDEVGTIIVPDETKTYMANDAAVYARVSDPSERRTRLPAQQKRVEDWATANGYHIVESVAEVGSGVNDKRRKLSALLKRNTWGVLIVERKDRLTRFGFEWFRLFIEQQDKRIIVINEAGDDRTDLIRDLVSIIYSFSARLYGQRRSKKAVAMVDVLTRDENGVDDAVEA